MRAHRTDPVSLIFALVFLAIAAWWLVAQLLDLPVPDAGWFVAGLLILVGVLGLLGALRAGRASAASATAAPAESAPADRAPAPADLPPGTTGSAPVPADLPPITGTDPDVRDRTSHPPA